LNGWQKKNRHANRIEKYNKKTATIFFCIQDLKYKNKFTFPDLSIIVIEIRFEQGLILKKKRNIFYNNNNGSPVAK